MNRMLQIQRFGGLGAGARPAARGFTLVELLVVVGIVGVLAALFATSLSHATAFARSAACKGNLRQQGLALAMYLNDFHAYPPAHDARVGEDSVRSGEVNVPLRAWAKLLKPYVHPQRRTPAQGRAFLCPEKELIELPGPKVALNSLTPPPAKTATAHGAYGYNSYGTGLNFPDLSLGLGKEWDGRGAVEPEAIAESRVLVPSEMIAIADSTSLSTIISPVVAAHAPFATMKLLPARRHSKGANVAFCDGHVERTSFRFLVEEEPDARRRWNNDNEPHPETW